MATVKKPAAKKAAKPAAKKPAAKTTAKKAAPAKKAAAKPAPKKAAPARTTATEISVTGNKKIIKSVINPNQSLDRQDMFGQLLTAQCSGIAQRVSEQMLPNMFRVGSTKPSVVPHEAILYRWWFPENSPVMEVLADFAKKDDELAALLKQVEPYNREGNTYYALYFGKSNNGYRRYCQHTTGNVHLSTIRLTVYGLCFGAQYDKAKEEQISEILRQCRYDWVSFKGEDNLVECIEGICIALGKYPLNVDGNPAISEKWRKYVMDKRKIVN